MSFLAAVNLILAKCGSGFFKTILIEWSQRRKLDRLSADVQQVVASVTSRGGTIKTVTKVADIEQTFEMTIPEPERRETRAETAVPPEKLPASVTTSRAASKTARIRRRGHRRPPS